MGSSHELPSRRKRRNSDCISNYVDRVRICDTKSITSESVYSKASSQKSGWRQKSYSSIDLTSNGDFQPGAGAFRYRDFDSQDDISIKNLKNNKNKEIQRDYEDIYNINPKAQGFKRDVIKEHNKINENKRDNNDICSLRRSKSLAVIREETFNDLSIDGPKTRRSQLIPRAKLVDRNFFRSRLSFALEEGLSFSLDSNLTSEINKSNSNTNTLNSAKNGSNNTSSALNNTKNNKINNNSSNNSNYLSWNCDKSDLGSIDSNFFKNSLHQSALLEKSNTDPKKIVSRVEVHNEHGNNGSSETVENGSLKHSKEKSENIINSNNNKSNNSDDNENSVNINEDTESGITIIEIKDRKQLSGPTSSVISYDSIYLSSESDKQTVLGEEEVDVELSHFDDIDLKIKDFEKIIKELNLIGDSEKSDTIIDNLYCQVAKGSNGSLVDLKSSSIEESKIDADTLSKYTDYISKGTLERLAIISGFSSINSRKLDDRNNNSNNSKKQTKDYENNSVTLSANKGHFQYSSLPDVDISKLLRDCELIDAKLRDDVSIELLEPYPDYDIDVESNDLSIAEPLYNTADTKNILKRELKKAGGESQVAIDDINTYQRVEESVNNRNIINTQESLNEPSSLEEEEEGKENPKGAPSIELVQLPTKELLQTEAVNKIIKEVRIDEREKNTTKIYIPDLGLELDYENSIASDEDFESPSTDSLGTTHHHNSITNTLNDFHHPFYRAQALNLITISGKKVIIDELAAKSEQNKDIIQKDSLDVKLTFAEKTRQRNIEKKKSPVNNKNKAAEENGFDSLEADSTDAVASACTKSSEQKKINSTDNNSQRHKTNIDKRKIKLPESKQTLKYSADSTRGDKKNLFGSNSDVDDTYYTGSAVIIEKENGRERKLAKSADKLGEAKDYTSFCILQKSDSIKMPRPQLLNIIDSKNSVPKLQQKSPHHHTQREQNKQQGTPINNNGMETNKDGRMMLTESDEKLSNVTEKEFLHKVDSVRNYWSRMLDSEVIEMKENNLKSMSKVFSTSKSSSDIPQSIRHEDGFQSFFPTVEIIELNNGETQAALVTARKLNDVEFDHVRYKVMKSEMFQKNIARGNNNRKETQFDGLMQYLQDYSFQELLAKNNVVIIEPVRTKIEKISEKPNKAQSGVCKITNGATQLHRSGSNNLKKHFFYHPIRVNKELYEDELPVPDTVRNVRKMFEDSLRPSCNGSKLSERDSKMSKSSDNLRSRKTIRYLTIDTSFDNNLAASKWDSISLSSGVSSAADLSSPCECQDTSISRNNTCNGSKENLDDNRNYGTEVLERNRECESSRGCSNAGKNQIYTELPKDNLDLMGKASTKDGGVSREKCNCNGRQLRNNFSQNEKYQLQQTHKKISHDYTGLKFKLVKSNSCSSRLELAGTVGSEVNAVEEMRNIVHGQRIQLYDENEEEIVERNENAENEYEDKEDLEHEETVKDMIYKLEARNFPATTKPRIIESRCIEKVPRDVKVTINNQTFEKASTVIKSSASTNVNLPPTSPTSPSQNSQSSIDFTNENVTVNNHISILKSSNTEVAADSHNPIQNENVDVVNSSNKMSSVKPKIVRNKNVDLAMIAVKKKHDVVAKDSKGFSNGGSDIKSMLLAQNETINEIQEIPNNNHNNGMKFRNTFTTTSAMQSVEMVRNQDKINCSHLVKNHQHTAVESSSSLSLHKSTDDSSRPTSLDELSSSSSSTSPSQPVKMVNWGTVGIVNKEYIANDNKLVKIKTYDEMEFEEFEVAGEHYDSLNSK